jgi:hypothetical protein
MQSKEKKKKEEIKSTKLGGRDIEKEKQQINSPL